MCTASVCLTHRPSVANACGCIRTAFGTTLGPCHARATSASASSGATLGERKQTRAHGQRDHASAHQAQTTPASISVRETSAHAMSHERTVCGIMQAPHHARTTSASTSSGTPSASAMSRVRTVCRIMQAPTTRMPRGSRPAHSPDQPCVCAMCRTVVRQLVYSGCACVWPRPQPQSLCESMRRGVQASEPCLPRHQARPPSAADQETSKARLPTT